MASSEGVCTTNIPTSGVTNNTAFNFTGKITTNTEDDDQYGLAPNRSRVYHLGHKGPYNVYIRAAKKTPLKHVSLSKFLFGKYPRKQILRITQMNNHKLRVEFNSLVDANDLVTSCDPTFERYRVYVPADQVEVEGVVRLSVEDNLQEVLDYGEGRFGQPSLPSVGILGVYRFESISKDGSGKIIDRKQTSLVRVTFPGSLLPAKLVINGLILPVEPYRRKAMFCENCLRTGHTQKFCVVKANFTRMETDNHFCSRSHLEHAFSNHILSFEFPPKPLFFSSQPWS